MVNSGGFGGCQMLNHIEEKETTNSKIVMSDLIVQWNILWNTMECHINMRHPNLLR